MGPFAHSKYKTCQDVWNPPNRKWTRHLRDTYCVLGMPHTCCHWISTQPCKADMIVLICYVRRLMLTEIKQIASSHSAGKQEGERGSSSSVHLPPVPMHSPFQHQGSWRNYCRCLQPSQPWSFPSPYMGLYLWATLKLLPPCFTDPYRAGPGFLPSQQGTTFYVTAL